MSVYNPQIVFVTFSQVPISLFSGRYFIQNEYIVGTFCMQTLLLFYANSFETLKVMLSFCRAYSFLDIYYCQSK